METPHRGRITHKDCALVCHTLVAGATDCTMADPREPLPRSESASRVFHDALFKGGTDAPTIGELSADAGGMHGAPV